MAETRVTIASPVRLSAAQRAEIDAHAAQTYPDECCGILLGREADGARVVERLKPLDNQWDAGERRRRFLITPQDMLQIQREADRRGEVLIGFYHSHPDAPARPSEFDREHALPWHSYLIAGVVNGTVETLTGWQLHDDRAAYDEVEVREQ
jgi:proteasome lid subunit RPN8/RPN11